MRGCGTGSYAPGSLKVLHVIRGMANSSGTTHIVGPLAAEQARQGASVSIYCVEKRSGPPILPEPELVESRCFPASLPLDNPGVSIALARALGSDIRRYDVLHVHAVWNFPSWWAMRSAYLGKVPYIVAPQGSFDPWALRQNRLGKRIYGTLTEVPYLRRASLMQALTAKEAEQIRAFGIKTPSKCIPNGIDRGLLDRSPNPDPARFGLPPDSRVLLFLSRVHPKKGLDVLVNAAVQAKQNIPKLRIVVAGSDAGSGYLEVIREQCRTAGVQDMFVFIGEVRGSDKLEVLAASHAFVLPSYSEGLPVAALEAMGTGLPVVLTHQCNIPEVAEYDAGLVVEPESEAVAGAIGELFALPEKRRRSLGANARTLISKKFTWDAIAKQTLDCYEEMAQGAVGS